MEMENKYAEAKWGEILFGQSASKGKCNTLLFLEIAIWALNLRDSSNLNLITPLNRITMGMSQPQLHQTHQAKGREGRGHLVSCTYAKTCVQGEGGASDKVRELGSWELMRVRRGRVEQEAGMI